MGTFFDSFMPALTGSLAQAPLAGAQGHVQGMTAAMELAQLQQQLKNQQLALQQSQQRFPYELQLQKQMIPLEIQGKQADIAYKNAMSKMYQGGMYPPGSIEEMMKRQLAIDPENPAALAYFSTMQKAKASAQGIPGAYDPETINTMAARARMDPSYHAVFSGPYGASNRQAFDKALANPGTEGQSAAKKASGIIGQQADTKVMRETLSDFGPKGISGKAVKTFNVAINHMDTLEQLANALSTGDYQTMNRLNQTLSKWVGSPKITNFEAAKNIVTDEVTKAIVGGMSALGDRDVMASKIAAMNSPDQLAGALRTWRTLMAGQLEGIELQYKQGTGRNDFSQRLTPAAQRELKQLNAPQAAPAPSATKPAKATSKAPTIGQMEDGYIYKGGDPSKQESWEKVK